jgi:hypothetical protein
MDNYRYPRTAAYLLLGCGTTKSLRISAPLLLVALWLMDIKRWQQPVELLAVEMMAARPW